MDIHYYDTGLTDYSSMHPWSIDFWFHMLWPWGFLNWIWLGLGILYIVVRLNDKYIYNNMK